MPRRGKMGTGTDGAPVEQRSRWDVSARGRVPPVRGPYRLPSDVPRAVRPPAGRGHTGSLRQQARGGQGEEAVTGATVLADLAAERERADHRHRTAPPSGPRPAGEAAEAYDAMRAGGRARRRYRVPLFWRLFLLTAIVLITATALLLGPVTVSTPVLLTEAAVLTVGLAAALGANALL